MYFQFNFRHREAAEDVLGEALVSVGGDTDAMAVLGPKPSTSVPTNSSSGDLASIEPNALLGNGDGGFGSRLLYH